MPKPVSLKDADLTRLRQAGKPELAPERPAVVHYRPGRATKTHLTVFFSPAVKDELRRLGIERHLTLQAQVTEALNDYFAKHGRPEIAE
jgi:Antitoxin-like ribbon-helix-helix